MTTKQQHALALAARGFYVFRLKKNGKTPLAKGWQQEATTDEDEIRELFPDNRDFNIGILTTKYDTLTTGTKALVVVDVDTKDGKQGNQTLHDLDVLGFDFPPTLTATTASGGKHLIYDHDFALAGGANKIGTHVDLKSNGGYIVAAGSTIDDNAYAWDNSAPIHHAPAWIVQKAGRPLAPTAEDKAMEVLDHAGDLTRANHYIAHSAPTANQGNRNDTAYKVACTLRDFGLSITYVHMLLIEWNATRCYPHLSPEELDAVTGSAYKHAKLPTGNNSPHAVFTPIPGEGTPIHRKLFYKWFADVTEAPQHVPLIEDFLDQQAMSVLYGESNSGKTFVALDIAYHIAAGAPWNNQRTLQGTVLYIAAEGGKGAENRILALKHKYNHTSLPLALIPCPINLFDSLEEMQDLAQLIKKAESEQGAIKLVVIDTLSRVLSGGNENSSEDMTTFIRNIDAIRYKTKAHVMIVHHSGKDTSKGARGHSSLRAATDTEIEIVDQTIIIRKQRDMEFGKPVGFELEHIITGTNAYGKEITSCAVNLVDPQARSSFNQDHRLNHRDLIALLALRDHNPDVKRQIGEYTHVVDQKVWAQCCKDFNYTLIPGAVPWPTSDSSFNTAFKRARDRLVAFGHVIEATKNQWVSKK